jgi:hypothetical protein
MDIKQGGFMSSLPKRTDELIMQSKVFEAEGHLQLLRRCF